MYWTEPEGYDHWLILKNKSKKQILLHILTCVAVWILIILTAVYRDFIAGHMIKVLVAYLVLCLAMIYLGFVVEIILACFKIEIGATEIRLDCIGVFSGENGEGRLSGVTIDEISGFKFVFVTWKGYRFHNLVIEKVNNDTLMFGIGELDYHRLLSKIETTLTRGCS